MNLDSQTQTQSYQRLISVCPFGELTAPYVRSIIANTYTNSQACPNRIHTNVVPQRGSAANGIDQKFPR